MIFFFFMMKVGNSGAPEKEAVGDFEKFQQSSKGDELRKSLGGHQR